MVGLSASVLPFERPHRAPQGDCQSDQAEKLMPCLRSSPIAWLGASRALPKSDYARTWQSIRRTAEKERVTRQENWLMTSTRQAELKVHECGKVYLTAAEEKTTRSPCGSSEDWLSAPMLHANQCLAAHVMVRRKL